MCLSLGEWSTCEKRQSIAEVVEDVSAALAGQHPEKEGSESDLAVEVATTILSCSDEEEANLCADTEEDAEEGEDFNDTDEDVPSMSARPAAGGTSEPVQMPACHMVFAAIDPAYSFVAGGQDWDHGGNTFATEETLVIFDWDDTVLPSTWVQSQGLRLDDVSEVSPSQMQQLTQVASAAAETLQIAAQLGTVVLVTNAERGWIELSCRKWMPSLLPFLENVKVLSARTTYETPERLSPVQWKLDAFEAEIQRIFGFECLAEPDRRKNVLSLGDSIHEREALLRTTLHLPNCRTKSLKFLERPDIRHVWTQHLHVANCFNQLVHHDGNLDLCIHAF